MRCKIFIFNEGNAYSFEKAINDFLKTTGGDVKFITQSETDNQLTITIFYIP